MSGITDENNHTTQSIPSSPLHPSMASQKRKVHGDEEALAEEYDTYRGVSSSNRQLDDDDNKWCIETTRALIERSHSMNKLLFDEEEKEYNKQQKQQYLRAIPYYLIDPYTLQLCGKDEDKPLTVRVNDFTIGDGVVVSLVFQKTDPDSKWNKNVEILSPIVSVATASFPKFPFGANPFVCTEKDPTKRAQYKVRAPDPDELGISLGTTPVYFKFGGDTPEIKEINVKRLENLSTNDAYKENVNVSHEISVRSRSSSSSSEDQLTCDYFKWIDVLVDTMTRAASDINPSKIGRLSSNSSSPGRAKKTHFECKDGRLGVTYTTRVFTTHYKETAPLKYHIASTTLTRTLANYERVLPQNVYPIVAAVCKSTDAMRLEYNMPMIRCIDAKKNTLTLLDWGFPESDASNKNPSSREMLEAMKDALAFVHHSFVFSISNHGVKLGCHFSMIDLVRKGVNTQDMRNCSLAIPGLASLAESGDVTSVSNTEEPTTAMTCQGRIEYVNDDDKP